MRRKGNLRYYKHFHFLWKIKTSNNSKNNNYKIGNKSTHINIVILINSNSTPLKEGLTRVKAPIELLEKFWKINHKFYVDIVISQPSIHIPLMWLTITISIMGHTHQVTNKYSWNSICYKDRL